MVIAEFAPAAVVVLIITSVVLMISRDWRLSIGALGIQYFAVFFLVYQSWPLEMAVVKLVAGWIAAAVLGMELVRMTHDLWDEERVIISRVFFRLIFAGLIGLVVFSAAPEIAKWMLQASYEQILGGFILLGIGSLHLGLSNQPFRIILGLLTVLSGFEILYGTIEVSPYVAGVLAVINLGIALLGVYLLAAPNLDGVE